MPRWDGKLYAGDSKRAGLTRAQSAESIPAEDPKMDGFIAMSYQDFRSFVATYVYACKQWKPTTRLMTAQEANERFKILIEEWSTEAPK